MSTTDHSLLLVDFLFELYHKQTQFAELLECQISQAKGVAPQPILELDFTPHSTAADIAAMAPFLLACQPGETALHMLVWIMRHYCHGSQAGGTIPGLQLPPPVQCNPAIRAKMSQHNVSMSLIKPSALKCYDQQFAETDPALLTRAKTINRLREAAQDGALDAISVASLVSARVPAGAAAGGDAEARSTVSNSGGKGKKANRAQQQQQSRAKGSADAADARNSEPIRPPVLLTAAEIKSMMGSVTEDIDLLEREGLYPRGIGEGLWRGKSPDARAKCMPALIEFYRKYADLVRASIDRLVAAREALDIGFCLGTYGGYVSALASLEDFLELEMRTTREGDTAVSISDETIDIIRSPPDASEREIIVADQITGHLSALLGEELSALHRGALTEGSCAFGFISIGRVARGCLSYLSSLELLLRRSVTWRDSVVGVYKYGILPLPAGIVTMVELQNWLWVELLAMVSPFIGSAADTTGKKAGGAVEGGAVQHVPLPPFSGRTLRSEVVWDFCHMHLEERSPTRLVEVVRQQLLEKGPAETADGAACNTRTLGTQTDHNYSSVVAQQQEQLHAGKPTAVGYGPRTDVLSVLGSPHGWPAVAQKQGGEKKNNKKGSSSRRGGAPRVMLDGTVGTVYPVLLNAHFERMQQSGHGADHRAADAGTSSTLTDTTTHAQTALSTDSTVDATPAQQQQQQQEKEEESTPGVSTSAGRSSPSASAAQHLSHLFETGALDLVKGLNFWEVMDYAMPRRPAGDYVGGFGRDNSGGAHTQAGEHTTAQAPTTAAGEESTKRTRSPEGVHPRGGSPNVNASAGCGEGHHGTSCQGLSRGSANMRRHTKLWMMSYPDSCYDLFLS